jgi:predicted RNA-binding Zn ribbon-like protein
MSRYHRNVPDADPDPLHLLRSFASTVGAEPGTDSLRTREEAAGWLRLAGLLPDGAGLSGADYNALLRLRGSLRDVLAAHTDGRADADAAARLTKALADGRLVLTVDAASMIDLASAARASYSGVVAAVAVAVARSAASGAWLRLKSCAAPGCDRAFVDDSGTQAARRCPAHAA